MLFRQHGTLRARRLERNNQYKTVLRQYGRIRIWKSERGSHTVSGRKRVFRTCGDPSYLTAHIPYASEAAFFGLSAFAGAVLENFFRNIHRRFGVFCIIVGADLHRITLRQYGAAYEDLTGMSALSKGGNGLLH